MAPGQDGARPYMENPMSVAPASAPRTRLLRDRNFIWLMSGGTLSGLGDQFTLIALPWLVLRLTGDPRMLGAVLALMGLPRALLMLFGGALVDRYSPKHIGMLTKHINTVLLGTLSALVYSGHAQLPLVLALALGMSLASAFAMPAGTSLLPLAVAPDRLQAANGMMMALRQLTQLAGPLCAALLFVLADLGRHHDARGLALAFGFDCLSFAVSAWTLSRVVPHALAPPPAQPILQALAASLALAWRDVPLRTCLSYWALVACILGGTLQVALPLLAGARLRGAASLAWMMGAHGAGALLGMALSGMLGRRFPVIMDKFGRTVLVVDGCVGLLLLPLGAIGALWQGMLIGASIGVLGGFVQVAMFTWIQQRVPPGMLGRMMSLFLFIFMGLPPLAAIWTGWIASRVTLGTLFGGAGLGLAGVAVLAWLFTPLRTVRAAPEKKTTDGLA
jgi:MFS family permease